METAAESLLVTVHEHTALVRVIGRGSFKISPALKKFGTAVTDRGCTRVIIDMDGCLGMDSTFMGVIGGMALRLKKQTSGRVIMTNLSPKNLSLLQTLGLDRLLDMHTAEPADAAAGLAGEEMARLDTSYAGRKVTAETMLSAHEDLLKVTPENLPKFRDVLAYLKEELKSANTGDEKGP